MPISSQHTQASNLELLCEQVHELEKKGWQSDAEMECDQQQ